MTDSHAAPAQRLIAAVEAIQAAYTSRDKFPVFELWAELDAARLALRSDSAPINDGRSHLDHPLRHFDRTCLACWQEAENNAALKAKQPSSTETSAPAGNGAESDQADVPSVAAPSARCVVVPMEVWNWLMGEGPDFVPNPPNGSAFPPGRYWWRSELCRRIEAAGGDVLNGAPTPNSRVVDPALQEAIDVATFYKKEMPLDSKPRSIFDIHILARAVLRLSAERPEKSKEQV